MKKLLLGSIIMCIAAISISIFQISCSKVTANPINTTQTGKIIYFTEYPTTNAKLWIANYDGTNATLIPLTLPPNVVYDNSVNYQTLRISPDGQTIFFSARDITLPANKPAIYSCDISGNNVTLIVSSPLGGIYLGQAF